MNLFAIEAITRVRLGGIVGRMRCPRDLMTAGMPAATIGWRHRAVGGHCRA